MCRTDVGKNTQIGTNHICQGIHVPFSGDTGLEDGYLMVGLYAKNRKRNPYLRVVALGAFGNCKLLTQHLSQPFFDDGFAITACDAYNRFSKLRSLISRQCLKCGTGIADRDETGCFKPRSRECCIFIYQKGANSRLDKGSNEGNPIRLCTF